jgi:hypothetical protein
MSGNPQSTGVPKEPQDFRRGQPGSRGRLGIPGELCSFLIFGVHGRTDAGCRESSPSLSTSCYVSGAMRSAHRNSDIVTKGTR